MSFTVESIHLNFGVTVLIAVKFLVLPFCMGKEILVYRIFVSECKCVCSFVGINMHGFVPTKV